MEIKNLTPNPNNPRLISDDKLRMLENSLKEFGDLSGFVFNRATGQLVGGHQRAKIFPPDAKIVLTKQNNKPSRTGTLAEGYVEFGGERFGYREVEWDIVREKAANIAANKGGGEWDPSKLTEWFQDLTDFGFDLDLTMFDQLERKAYLPEESNSGNAADDHVPETAQNEFGVITGQVWQLGSHRMMCGDSTDEEAVVKLLNGCLPDVCFTSPPYNAGKFEPTGAKLEAHRREHGKKKPAMTQKYLNNNDDMTEEDYLNFLDKVINIGCNYAETLMLNIGLLENAKRAVMILLGKYHKQFKDIIYWNKRSSTPHIVQGIMTMVVEPIFCFGKYSSRKFPQASFKGNFSNLVEGHNAAKDNDVAGIHSATFPVYLPQIVLENFTTSSVLDLFLGSGTTLIAAEKTNRRCYGMEIDPHYCSVVIKRWQDFTGQKAQLLKEHILRKA